MTGSRLCVERLCVLFGLSVVRCCRLAPWKPGVLNWELTMRSAVSIQWVRRRLPQASLLHFVSGRSCPVTNRISRPTANPARLCAAARPHRAAAARASLTHTSHTRTCSNPTTLLRIRATAPLSDYAVRSPNAPRKRLPQSSALRPLR